jgi:pyrroline-5-carboxylate reductase
MIEKLNVTVIGPGVMGEAILSSLIKNGHCAPGKITISGPDETRNQLLVQNYSVKSTTRNDEAVKAANIVVLCVKPQKIKPAVEPFKNQIANDALLISIIAGVPLETLMTLSGHDRIIRAMPNTPARIARGITAWTATPAVSQEQLNLTRELLGVLGKEVFVDDENYLDMATAVSGTGPAYIFLFMEAMIDAGVHLGLPRRIAEQLVTETIAGSVEYYESNREHPAKMRNDVTSPGGTSAEALYYLEKAGFRTALSRAIFAAYERSIELGQGIQAKIDREK